MTGFAADRGGSVADAFFGASPVVASALGIRSGATPRGPIHVTTPLRNDTLKPDISTLPELGHFYFALTRRCDCAVAGNWRSFAGGPVPQTRGRPREITAVLR